MGLQLAALHALLALTVEWAQHGQFVQQVAHQKAGGTAILELKPLAVDRTEVLVMQEGAEALEAVRVAARRVHGLQQRLQADVAHQLVIHLVLIFKQVTVPTIMTLTTFLTHPHPCYATRWWKLLGLRHGLKKLSWTSSGLESLCHFLSL